jgi:hypothetical protein
MYLMSITYICIRYINLGPTMLVDRQVMEAFKNGVSYLLIFVHPYLYLHIPMYLFLDGY